jgi:hypothetical protein
MAADEFEIERRLRFRSGVCPKHRMLFITLLLRRGIHDWRLMEWIRVLFVEEAKWAFPARDIQDWLTDCCIGCDHEPWCIETIDRLAEAEGSPRQR